ncbi:MAG: hypothetical protein ACOCRX_01295 [Candidatus Woesearchaeota archaeon]
MIKLTYTKEMQKQDNLWESEKEDLSVMEKLFKEIIDEAKAKGFTGVTYIYDAPGEKLCQIFENEKQKSLAHLGEYEDFPEVGCCKYLIKCLEQMINDKMDKVVVTIELKNDYGSGENNGKTKQLECLVKDKSNTSEIIDFIETEYEINMDDMWAIKNIMTKRYRTKKEMIKYFKNLAFQYEKDAYRDTNLEAKGKAEAYELAAFELKYNMK